MVGRLKEEKQVKWFLLVGNDGATGNSPFTITPADTDFYEYTMTGITASTTIKFTTEGATSDKRAIIFGINIK